MSPSTPPRSPFRRLLVAAIAGLASLAATGLSAQTGAPVKLLVGFSAGGGTDAVARLLADKLKDELGAPVVVENRPGAGGQLAAQAVKAAPADGSVLFLTIDHTLSILPQVVKNPGFDTAKDFTPVAGFASYVSVLALSAQTPPKTFKDYLAWMRQNGGKGDVGIPAPASVPEFLVKSIGDKTKLDMVAVPYKGAAPMLGDMMGNQIAAGVAGSNDVLEAHNAQRIRVVAVAGTKRHAALPEVPTFSELGIAGFEEIGYYGIYAPAGTPAAVVNRVSEAMRKVLLQQPVQQRMTTMGLTVDYLTPQQMGARERAFTQAWGKLITASGFQPQ